MSALIAASSRGAGARRYGVVLDSEQVAAIARLLNQDEDHVRRVYRIPSSS
ncbi:MAG: hypothetical protein WA208_11450 [Thermoanaerobaculia bacterium]